MYQKTFTANDVDMEALADLIGLILEREDVYKIHSITRTSKFNDRNRADYLILYQISVPIVIKGHDDCR